MKLIIAEKPSVAKSIASALGAKSGADGCFQGNGLIVSWCVGHLVSPMDAAGYDERFKKWRYDDLPILPEPFRYVLAPGKEDAFENLRALMNRPDVDTVVNACDAGREGELIFRLVYEMAGCNKPVERLWISSMEDMAIREGMSDLRPGAEYDSLYQSALCRQKADWLVGINATRLFSVLYHRTLNVGRVQTPTLAMLAERDGKIMLFKKEKYHHVRLQVDGAEAVSEKFTDPAQAKQVQVACQNGQAVCTSVTREQKKEQPPKLYDLTTLQREANRIFGYTAKQTLDYSQSLYEKKLLTYPRTDSRYLTADMAETASCVIHLAAKAPPFDGGSSFFPLVELMVSDKDVSDHHAIIPTMEIEKADMRALPVGERNLLLLVCCKLLCASASPYDYETVTATFDCGGHTFTAKGKRILAEGWREIERIFRSSLKEKPEDTESGGVLPNFTEGQTFEDVAASVTEHFTSPPKPYTEDSLLSAMERAGNEDMSDDVERKGLGTPATRADIIEKLVKDGFVKREKKQMIPTEDGMKLITVLPDVVKSPKLTADWENALTLVAKGEMEREDFMADIETMVSDLIHTYHEVSDEQKKMFAQEQKVLGKCPNCGGEVVKGKYGAFCKNKCGMNVSRIMGVALSDEQVESLLAGKKTLLKGLTSKAGKKYDAYIIPSGTEEYHYTKDGEEKSGVQFKFVMEFPNKKFTGKKK